jgi:hypothetical protein
MKAIMKFFRGWAWQFPQMLLGIILVKITGAEKRVCKTKGGREIIWYQYDKDKNRFTRFISGVSLGRYIILPYENETDIKHEYGHSVQSLYLGPLYLLAVGLYSAVFCNLWDRLFHKAWPAYDRLYWYYKTRWAERWADRLGGAERDKDLAEIDRPENAGYPRVG